MKKMKSIVLTAVFTVGALSFYQCTNDQDLFPGFEHEPDFSTIQEVHDAMTTSDTVTFAFTDLTNIQFSGPAGTRVSFPEGSLTLVEGGNPPVAPVTFKMIEVYRRGDVVKHNIQNFMNQAPLVSGGIFWLMGTDANGGEIQLQPGKAFIPYKTLAEGYQPTMASFIGQIQTAPSGNINSWQTGTFPVTYDPAAGTTGEFIVEGIASGWNSAHSPFDPAATFTQFSAQVTNSSNLEKTQIFFVSNDFTLVAGLNNASDGKLLTAPASIPQGMSGRLIAIALVDGKLNFGSQDVTINGDDEFSMSVSQGTIGDLMNLLAGIN